VELSTYKQCIICNGNSFETLGSYKHYWIKCLDCENVKRFRKSRYMLDFQPIKIILKIGTKLLGREAVLNELLPIHKILEQEDKFYEFYTESCKLVYEETKWKPMDDQFLNLLEQVGIPLAGKNILAVSEGPGFLAKRISKDVVKFIVTEINHGAVEAMKKYLGIEAYKYNFNEDKLSDIFPQDKFDLILLRSCINFCNDLKALAKELTKIIKKNGVVYLTFHRPTLGGCLQWMHDEYTSNFWYHPETMLKTFADEGFRVLFPYTKFKYVSNPQKRYRARLVSKLFYYLFWYYYFLKSKINNKHFSREINEISYVLFFEKL
jgi:SAM-dependent methyltransferase